MVAKFGTSGLRGLVSELTRDVIESHMRAFITACDIGTVLCVGRDLRSSSPRIANDAMRAAQSMGVQVIDCGAVPTPALALEALARGAGAVMITGSHIPADRNGLKFYSRLGEISKSNEVDIVAALDTKPLDALVDGPAPQVDDAVGERFVNRYVEGCGVGSLLGRKVGIYAHSAVARDLLAQIFSALGAEVIELGRSETFIPVDTEAVDPQVRDQIKLWVSEHALDALISTDGDLDRPLMADELGQIIPGDILGQITAQALGAKTVVTPISSNSGVTLKDFDQVQLTRIGSPYVIAGMEQVGGQVIGYEANGGFLLGFSTKALGGYFSPLPTRDCVLPLVMPLIASQGGRLSERVAQEPPVVTLADRLQDLPQERAQSFVRAIAEDSLLRAAFLKAVGVTEQSVDLTDGVRMTTVEGHVLHVRPSGNAPELRLYVEATDSAAARELLETGLRQLEFAITAQNLSV